MTEPIIPQNQPESEAIAHVNEGTFEQLYNQEKAAHSHLKAVMVAAKVGSGPSPNPEQQPQKLAEQVKRQLGPLALLGMTRAEKLAALGLGPNDAPEELLRSLFGRGANHALASDLHKSNAGRYRSLREAALLTNAYGA